MNILSDTTSEKIIKITCFSVIIAVWLAFSSAMMWIIFLPLDKHFLPLVIMFAILLVSNRLLTKQWNIFKTVKQHYTNKKIKVV